MGPLFFVQNIGLGTGLAMDACAVSMSNGLNEPNMSKRKWFIIAFTFAFFQALMPILGYFAGHAFIKYIEPYIPWIALVLLTFLGGKMIYSGSREIYKARREAKAALPADSRDRADKTVDCVDVGDKEDIAPEPTEEESSPKDIISAADRDEQKVCPAHRLTAKTLFVQAIATSIDALSVGLTIAAYTIAQAFVAALIIAAVTLAICLVAVWIGKKFGEKLGSGAEVAGGIILVAIGLEICLTGLL